MSALEATAYLVGTDPGTFLVRRRDPTCPDALSAPFAISVMYVFVRRSDTLIAYMKHYR